MCALLVPVLCCAVLCSAVLCWAGLGCTVLFLLISNDHFSCTTSSMLTAMVFFENVFGGCAGSVAMWSGNRHLGDGAKVAVFSQDLAQVNQIG